MKELIVGILLMIIGWLINYLYKKNTLYYNIIKDFRVKLSGPRKEGRTLSKSEIEQYPFIPNSFKDIRVIDVSGHQTNITESELDIFYNKLRYFDYSFVFFKKYYQERTQEFTRLYPKAENKNFHLVLLQDVLKEDSLHPLEFRKVLIHHIKWKWKITSYFWTRKIKRKKRSSISR